MHAKLLNSDQKRRARPLRTDPRGSSTLLRPHWAPRPTHKDPQHHAPKSPSAQNSPGATPAAACPVQNSPGATPSRRVRYKTRPAQLPRGASGTKLTQHTKRRLFWAFFSVLGENIHAHGTTNRRRANFVTHRTRQHKQLERQIAPARGIGGHRETFFAHARPQEPFLAHFD